MPWEDQAGSPQGTKKTKNTKKNSSEDGVANPLLDDDLDFDTPFADLEDETVDIEGAMDDLESALEASDANGPKWHKTTYVIFPWSSCVC